MIFPSTTIPREYSKITAPPGPIRCPDADCRHVGEPIPVMTCLGDFVLRLGGWCEKCRRLACTLDMTLENLSKAGMFFLTYEQKVPKDGYAWPSVPSHFFDMKDFPFGANSPPGEPMSFMVDYGAPADPLIDEPVTREEAGRAHAEALRRVRQAVTQEEWSAGVADKVIRKWSESGYEFSCGRQPSRREVMEFKRLIEEWVSELGEP